MRSLDNIINFLNPAAPKGLIDCAESWVRQQLKRSDQRAPQPTAWCKGFADAREMIFYDPQLNSADDYSELPNLRWTVTPESKLFYIQGARVLGTEGTVISPDNRVFREFTFPPLGSGWLNHSCFKRRRIPAIKELNGWYATVTYPTSQFYFHWMLDSLPRMRLLADYIDLLDGVIVPEGRMVVHEQSLGVLGISPDKLIPVGPNSHYRVRHLFVPKYFAFYNPPDWLNQWFKQAFLTGAESTTSKQTGKRIYISRADAGHRRVTNEMEVIAFLQSLDFESFTLTDMPFLDQARLFFEADIVVAPHGAALANLVFCRPGARLLEIFTPTWMPPCFYALARAGRLKYAYMVAEEWDVSIPTNPQMTNMAIPIETLKSKLLQIIG